MKPSPFNYLNVTTIENALDALSSNDNASLIAGGQSLVPMMNFRLAQPDLIIDISNINELKNVTEEKDYVEIGSLLTHTNAINSICLISSFVTALGCEKSKRSFVESTSEPFCST